MKKNQLYFFRSHIAPKSIKTSFQAPCHLKAPRSRSTRPISFISGSGGRRALLVCVRMGGAESLGGPSSSPRGRRRRLGLTPGLARSF